VYTISIQIVKYLFEIFYERRGQVVRIREFFKQITSSFISLKSYFSL
jgi:hypothetical protein